MSIKDIEVQCEVCNAEHTIKVRPFDYELWEEDGEPIRDVMPYLDDSEICLLKFHVCLECMGEWLKRD